MGQKITAVLTILILLTGCSSFDLNIRNNGAPIKATKILIGNFEFRNLSYDPYVSAEYREALRYEFFRRGINVLIIPESEDSPKGDSATASAVAGEYSGDILIRGVITQRESGFLSDREIASSVNILVYAADGQQIGESYFYTEEPASDESVKRSAVVKFVTGFISNTKSFK